MAKRKKKLPRKARKRKLALERNAILADRDYFVYWSTGLKSKVRGLGILQRLAEYMKALRIVDCATAAEVYTAPVAVPVAVGA